MCWSYVLRAIVALGQLIPNGVPWKYILTKWFLPTTDNVTDSYSGVIYYYMGHERWAYSIWFLMLCPLVAFCIFEISKGAFMALTRKSFGQNGTEETQDSHDLRLVGCISYEGSPNKSPI